MHRRTCMSLALAALFAAGLTGCDDDPPAVTPEKAADRGTAANPWVVGMSQCNLGEPWRVQMNRDIEAAAKEHDNVQVVFKDAQNDSLKQRAQVGELLAQKVDLLIISPKETAPLTKPVAEVFAAGVPVIVLDRRVSGDQYTTFIGADNVKIGRAAGEHARKLLGGKGKVVELKGLMTSSPGQDRHEGFIAGLAPDDDLRIVFDADMAWLEGNARKEMSSALARESEIDLVYAHNDPGAHGAYLAAKQAGREGLKIIGIDALPHEGVQYVKDGKLAATFLYPTGGREAIDTALAILEGGKVPKEITLGTRIYTAENVATGGSAIE